MKKITAKQLEQFKYNLVNEEKSTATIEKYIRDLSAFSRWLGKSTVDKHIVLEYKEYLIQNYKPSSVNSIISSINSFFTYVKWYDCRVKALKIQKRIFSSKEKELSKAEYERLVYAAKLNKNRRLYLVMQTICSTGMRVSELKFINADAVKTGVANIKCKGKLRQVFLPKELRRMLSKYVKEQKITSGPIFVTKTGKPLDRSNIWADMKKLCQASGVSRDKVYPHNLRHLFARTYYSRQKDIVRLADVLGHTSVNTTRIYTIESGDVHRRQIERLGLIFG